MTMHCKQCKRLLIDNDFSQYREDYLKSCDECAALGKDLEILNDFERNHGNIALPSSLLERCAPLKEDRENLSPINHAHKPTRTAMPLWALPLALAASLLFFFVASALHFAPNTADYGHVNKTSASFNKDRYIQLSQIAQADILQWNSSLEKIRYGLSRETSPRPVSHSISKRKIEPAILKRLNSTSHHSQIHREIRSLKKTPFILMEKRNG